MPHDDDVADCCEGCIACCECGIACFECIEAGSQTADTTASMFAKNYATAFGTYSLKAGVKLMALYWLLAMALCGADAFLWVQWFMTQLGGRHSESGKDSEALEMLVVIDMCFVGVSLLMTVVAGILCLVMAIAVFSAVHKKRGKLLRDLFVQAQGFVEMTAFVLVLTHFIDFLLSGSNGLGRGRFAAVYIGAWAGQMFSLFFGYYCGCLVASLVAVKRAGGTGDEMRAAFEFLDNAHLPLMGSPAAIPGQQWQQVQGQPAVMQQATWVQMLPEQRLAFEQWQQQQQNAPSAPPQMSMGAPATQGGPTEVFGAKSV